MKRKSTCFSLIYFISAVAFAQFETGQKLIGGNIIFSANWGNLTPALDNRNVYHNSNTLIIVSPSIAKFTSAAQLVGIGVIYGYSQNKLKEENPDNGNAYKNMAQQGGINFFSQRFISLGTKLYFTIKAEATALMNTNKQSNIINKALTKTKSYSIAASVGPGISYKINKRFLFDAFLSNLLSTGFQHSLTSTNYPLPSETKTRDNSFYISSSLSNTSLGNVGLGFRWLLKKQ